MIIYTTNIEFLNALFYLKEVLSHIETIEIHDQVLNQILILARSARFMRTAYAVVKTNEDCNVALQLTKEPERVISKHHQIVSFVLHVCPSFI